MARSFESAVARQVIDELVELLGDAVMRIVPVGSLRREVSRVHDLDVLCIPRLIRPGADPTALIDRLFDLSFGERIHLREGTPTARRFVHVETGIPVDLYLTDMRAWSTMLVSTTGSRRYVRRLCAHAKKRSQELLTDGRGIRRLKGRVVQPRSEHGVFRMLGLNLCPPRDRT